MRKMSIYKKCERGKRRERGKREERKEIEESEEREDFLIVSLRNFNPFYFLLWRNIRKMSI
jgi:hypothetical protein